MSLKHRLLLRHFIPHVTLLASLVLFASCWAPRCRAEDPVFSGPQPGEPLVSFQATAVYGEQSGQDFDPIDTAAGKPTLLVFVHQLTRPGVSLTRGLTNYAADLPGVYSAIIWLSDDRAGAEAYLNRAKKSLNLRVPVGISVDGGEGPGAYGLNRKVELTILVANDNSVEANFALVQPSVSEGHKIAGELARLVGKEPPTAEAFQKLANPGMNRMARERMRRGRGDGKRNAAIPGKDLRPLMRSLISATDEKQQKAAIEAINQWVGDDTKRRLQRRRISIAVLERELGSPGVQSQLKKWAERKSESDDEASQESK